MLCYAKSFQFQSDSFVTLWIVACWAPLSMGFSRQEYWSGLPYPPSGDLPNPGTEPSALHVWILYHLRPQGNPLREYYLIFINKKSSKSGSQNPT